MNNKSFNFYNIDVMKEVANIGTGNAVTSFANIMNERIRMSVPEVEIPEFKNLNNCLFDAETLVAGLLVYISGDINAMMMYITDEYSACKTVNHLLKKKRNNFTEFDDIDLSALEEVGNILTGSYSSALSTLLNLKINKSVPYLCIDMAGAVLSVPAIEFGKVADRVLLIK